MAIADMLFPGKRGTTNTFSEADRRELHIEELRGGIETVLRTTSDIVPRFSKPIIRGTSKISNRAMGQNGGLSKVVPGEPITTTTRGFGKVEMAIDTPVITRERISELDDLQADFAVRQEVAMDQGRQIAEFIDETYFIAAMRAGLATNPAHVGLPTNSGFRGGNQVQMASQAATQDPARLLAAIYDLETQFQNRRVNMQRDGMVIVVRPDVMNILRQNEWLINSNYKTSFGTELPQHILKPLGVPLISSVNLRAGENITGHLMSNTSNNNAYDGDFTKVVAVAFNQKALMDGWAYHVKPNMRWDEETLTWEISTRVAFAVAPKRPEFAGVITFA